MGILQAFSYVTFTVMDLLISLDSWLYVIFPVYIDYLTLL